VSHWWTRLPIPLLTRLLGRRRSWLLLKRCTIIVALVGMALDPRQALTRWCGARWPWPLVRPRRTSRWTLTALSPLPPTNRPRGAAYQTGYRIAMIWAGAGALDAALRVATGVVNTSRARGTLVMAVSCCWAWPPRAAVEPARARSHSPTPGVAANGADRAVCGHIRQANVVILALVAVYASATW
jgi:PAT family beta-lactamase induction signal transducer AmpG